MMVTGVTTATCEVGTQKFTLLAPAGSVTVAGVVATDESEVLKEISVSTAAGALKYAWLANTVVPPTGEELASAIEVSARGATVSVAVRVTPLAVAVMVTGVAAATAVVVMTNVAWVAPCGTVTLAGTAATAGSDELRFTAIPAAGAAPPITTLLPLNAVPPTVVVDPSVREVSPTGFSVRFAVLVTLPSVAVIVTVVGALTAMLWMVNAAWVAPAATVAVAGTVARAGSELLRLTVTPPAGAALFSATLFPVSEAPPVIAAAPR